MRGRRDNMDVDNCKIKMDNEQLARLAKKHGGINENDIKIKGIYITDVGIAVHIIIMNSCNPDDEKKEALGRFLKFISSCAEQFGYILPLFAVIECEECQREIIQKWAADQDWHRGDFSLFLHDDSKTVDKMLAELLGVIDEVSKFKKTKPLTVDSIKFSLKNEIEVRKDTLSNEHYRFLETIYGAMSENSKTLNNAVEDWVNKELKEITETIKSSEASEKRGLNSI